MLARFRRSGNAANRGLRRFNRSCLHLAFRLGKIVSMLEVALQPRDGGLRPGFQIGVVSVRRVTLE
jgi:hypothetical protein